MMRIKHFHETAGLILEQKLKKKIKRGKQSHVVLIHAVISAPADLLFVFFLMKTAHCISRFKILLLLGTVELYKEN